MKEYNRPCITSRMTNTDTFAFCQQFSWVCFKFQLAEDGIVALQKASNCSEYMRMCVCTCLEHISSFKFDIPRNLCDELKHILGISVLFGNNAQSSIIKNEKLL